MYGLLWLDNILKSGAKKSKIIFKVVLSNAYQELSFDIFTVGISSWNMILTSNDFWHNIHIYNFDAYNVFLAKYTCAVMTVLQGHIYTMKI